MLEIHLGNGDFSWFTDGCYLKVTMANIVLVMLNSFWGNIFTDRYFSQTSWIICSYMGLYFSQGQNYQYLFIPVVYIWKRREYQTTWPASWETYMQVRKQQLELDMEQQTGSK